MTIFSFKKPSLKSEEFFSKISIFPRMRTPTLFYPYLLLVKMYITVNTGLLIIFLKIFAINSAIIAWSNQKLDISPLLPFDDEDLEKLVLKLDIKKVFLFKVALKNPRAVPENLKEIIDPFYSAYNPNGNIGTANATELSINLDGCNGLDIHAIRKITGPLSNLTNFLGILDITYSSNNNLRRKRAIAEISPSPNPPNDENKATIFIGEYKKAYTLLYSSKAPKLELNNKTFYLIKKETTKVLIDQRLNIIMMLGEGDKIFKVILRFAITIKSGYWYIPSVEVHLDNVGNNVNIPTTKVNLNTSENIMASRRFSYHCSGQTIFFEPINGTRLTLYDLQVQINATTKRFGDANDCVPFTSVPIWSGLFVTSILGLGLIVALTALMDIKTMDKFDNQATKNLGITVMD